MDVVSVIIAVLLHIKLTANGSGIAEGQELELQNFKIAQKMNRITKFQFSTSTCLLAILCCVLFSSCQNSSEEKTKPKRLYTLYKSDDNNWTTSGKIECDSFNFITNNHVEFFVDGRKSNLKGGMIKAFTNDHYVSPK